MRVLGYAREVRQGVSTGQRSAISRGNIYSQLYEMISLFLSIPCFKVSHFFFKLGPVVREASAYPGQFVDRI